MSRTIRLKANDDGWTEWQTPPRQYRTTCCDCGLVHDIEYRVIVVGRKRRDGSQKVLGLNPAGCQMQFRLRRNERSTAQFRRHARKPQ